MVLGGCDSAGFKGVGRFQEPGKQRAGLADVGSQVLMGGGSTSLLAVFFRSLWGFYGVSMGFLVSLQFFKIPRHF